MKIKIDSFRRTLLRSLFLFMGLFLFSVPSLFANEGDKILAGFFEGLVFMGVMILVLLFVFIPSIVQQKSEKLTIFSAINLLVILMLFAFIGVLYSLNTGAIIKFLVVVQIICSVFVWITPAEKKSTDEQREGESDDQTGKETEADEGEA